MNTGKVQNQKVSATEERNSAPYAARSLVRLIDEVLALLDAEDFDEGAC